MTKNMDLEHLNGEMEKNMKENGSTASKTAKVTTNLIKQNYFVFTVSLSLSVQEQ